MKILGVVGAVLFVAVFLVEGALRPGYDPISQPVSALALGERGWIQGANFVITGLLMAGCGMGLWRVSRLGGLLIVVFGLALVASGIFPMDQAAHEVAGAVVFLSLPAACVVFAVRLPGWWRLYSVATGLAGLALFFWFGVAYEGGATYAGLIQRVLIVVDWSWIAALALRARPSGGR